MSRDVGSMRFEIVMRIRHKITAQRRCMAGGEESNETVPLPFKSAVARI